MEHYETRRRKKNGQIIDVALTVSPVRDTAGQIVGASKIARDISDRKQAEENRALLLAREREARRTAELLNQAAPRLSAQLDLEKLVHEVTDVATTLVGAEVGWLNTDVPAATFRGEACDALGRCDPGSALPRKFAGPWLSKREYAARHICRYAAISPCL